MEEATAAAPLYRMVSDASKPPAPREQWIADFMACPGWTLDSATALFDRMTRAQTLRLVIEGYQP